MNLDGGIDRQPTADGDHARQFPDSRGYLRSLGGTGERQGVHLECDRGIGLVHRSFRRMRSREAIAQHDQGVARTVADCDRHLIACARATLQGSLGGPQRSLWGEGPKHVFLMAARALAP